MATIFSVFSECGAYIVQFLSVGDIVQFSQGSHACWIAIDDDSVWISLFKKYCSKILVVPSDLFCGKWKELFRLCNYSGVVRAFNTISEAVQFCSEGDKIIVNRGVYRECLQISKSVDLIGVPDPNYRHFIERNQFMLECSQNKRESAAATAVQGIPWASGPSSIWISRYLSATKEFLSRPMNDVIIEPPFNEGRTPIVLSGSVGLKNLIIRARSDPIVFTIIEVSNGTVFIEDCDIVSNAKFIIGTKMGTEVTVTGCRIWGAKSAAIYLFNSTGHIYENVILYSRVGVFARTDSRGEVMNNFIHFCGDGITLTNRPLRSTRNTTSKQNRIQAKKQEQRCSDVFTAVKVSTSEPVKEVFANQENKKNNTNVENNSDNVKARFVEVTIDNPNFIVMNNILTKCNEHTGLVVSHFDGVIVSKNVFHKSRDLRIQKSTNVVISENEMLSCLSAGIGVNKSERVQIMNNKIQSCRLAIGLVDVGDVEIFKNSFTDWRPLSVGIETFKKCHNVFINGNLFEGFGVALIVNDTVVSMFHDNVLTGQSAQSIRVNFLAKIQSIVGNTFKDTPLGIFLNKHWKDKLDLNRVMRENVFVHVDKQIKIDEDITSPQVKEALDKNNCTYCCTGENFQRQYSWSCYTCGLSDDTGICEVCKNVCHNGHHISSQYRLDPFFCDCGWKFSGCKAKPEKNFTSPQKLEIAENIARTEERKK